MAAAATAAPLALTLTWSAASDGRLVDARRRLRKRRRAAPGAGAQTAAAALLLAATAAGDVSHNGISTSGSLSPAHAELDADPWADFHDAGLDEAQQGSGHSDARQEPFVTALLPISMERIVLALSDGSLTIRSLAQLNLTGDLAFPPPSAQPLLSSPPTRLQGHISSLQQLQLPVNGTSRARAAAAAAAVATTTATTAVAKIIVGTTEQGELLIWDAATLTLFAELPLFTCAIDAAVLLDQDATMSNGQQQARASNSRLNGCLACAAADGTLAILHLDVVPSPLSSSSSKLQPSHTIQATVQHIIPSRGSSAPLQALYLRNAELLLLYSDSRARLWDTAVAYPFFTSGSEDPSSSSSLGSGLGGAELRRSIGAEQALSLVEDDNKAFDALYGSAGPSGSMLVPPAPRPNSMYTPAANASPRAGGGVAMAATQSASGHLAPPASGPHDPQHSHLRSSPLRPHAPGTPPNEGSSTPTTTPNLSSNPFSRPRFAAASHAAQALLLGLNGGSGSPSGFGFGSRTASGTASPNPAGPIVPTARWIGFHLVATSSLSGTGGQGAGGVLSNIDEDPAREGLGESSGPETFTLRADLRRAIEAAAKALAPKGNNPEHSASAVMKGKMLPSASGATRAFGILRPLLGALIPALPEGAASSALREAWKDLAEKVGLDLPAGRKLKEATGRPRLGHLCSQKGIVRTEVDDARPPSSHSDALTIYLVTLASFLRILSRISGFRESVDTLRHDFIDPRAAYPPPEGSPPVALETLSLHFLDSANDIRETARHVLHSAFRALPQPDIDDLCRRWEEALPSRQIQGKEFPLDDQHQAVILIGLLGSQRYKLLPPTTLKDVAASIMRYLHEPASALDLTIALEMIVRGFATWQHYFDAMEVMRTLFWLSTNAEQPGPGVSSSPQPDPHPHPSNGKNGSSSGPVKESKGGADGGASATSPTGGRYGALAHVPAEVRLLARRATLHIAGENTPLFMTTLSHDILHARSAAHCSATMRLVTFLVRQEPLILLANLPRLAEAVVKSLDPTVTAMREAVMQAATVMISDLVHTYPSIDFHGRAQRLAVGTHEGACILYDVKTATRLYVLEGHHGAPCDACSFSPDGRRLITVSHSEGVGSGRALIWKVGQSFTSVLMPGSMPRQGGSDRSGAYKAIDFVMSDGAMAQVARDPLGSIRFEWDGEGEVGGGSSNNVRVKLGEVSLSFSVT